MTTNRTLAGVEVVFLGSFTPGLFQPAALAKDELIQAEEAAKAKVEIIHAEVCAYSTDWLRLWVTRGQFVANAVDLAHMGPLRDLILSLFRGTAPSVITMMGINQQAHFKLVEPTAMKRLFDRIAPTAPLNAVLPGAVVQRVSYSCDRTADLPKGFAVKLNPTVGPSGRNDSDVYIGMNLHHEGPKSAEGIDYAVEFLGHLERNWIENQKELTTLSDKILLA